MYTELLCEVEEYLNGRRIHKRIVYESVQNIDHEIVAHIQSRINQGLREETLYELVVRYIRRLKGHDFYRKNGELNEAAFYQYARIDKSTWSDLRWEKIVPTKKTLLKLVVALELNEEEAAQLLQKGSNSFNAKDIRDQIILALIDLRCYDIYNVYDVLEEYRLNGPCPFENIYNLRSKES